LLPVLQSITLITGVSFLCSLCLWTFVPFPLPVRLLSVLVSLLAYYFLLQLRFTTQMTVTLWTRLWGGLAPVFATSLVTIPAFPFLPFLLFLVAVTIIVGIWAAYRFYPLVTDARLHTSRFARIDEIEPLLARTPLTDSLILGSVRQFFFYRYYICVRPTPTKKEIGHSLVIAPSGMGKTTMIRSQIAVLRDTSAIITDPKGELFYETAGDRARIGPVYVLDPTAGVGHCFDPLHGITEEGEYATIADLIAYEPGDDQPFWIKSAAIQISCLFQAARIEQIPPVLYLRFMSRLGLSGVVERLRRLDLALATLFCTDAGDKANPSEDKTLKSVWSTTMTYIAPITTERLVRCFVRSDFTAETLLLGEFPATVYLRLPEEHLERLPTFVRLVIGSLGKDLIATWNSVRGRGCRRVFLFHEEGGIFPLPNLAGFISTARSKGITYNGYYQSTGQLEDAYGPEKARTIRQNMYTTVFLKPNDTEDSERIETKLGRGSAFSHSKNLRQGSEFSEGFSEQALPVMAARQLEEMNEDHAIVFHGNGKPIKAQRLKWWQHDLFKRRQGLPTPILPLLPNLPDFPLQPNSTHTPHVREREHDRFVDPDKLGKKRETLPREQTKDTNRTTTTKETTLLDLSKREKEKEADREK
jgi:type IV secretory pathway TraG/TraD family ATPase VirD4